MPLESGDESPDAAADGDGNSGNVTSSEVDENGDTIPYYDEEDISGNQTSSGDGAESGETVPGRGFHSFTFQLNLSRFCHKKYPKPTINNS
jgi:hypothetical protein